MVNINKNLTFSGTDTLAFIILPSTTPIVLGSLTTLSYSSYRIKKPVNTIGGILIKGIAKGGRVVAGTLIFTLINQHWVNELLDAVPWLRENAEDVIYSDELPLFDIMLVSANEYGNYVSMMIYGVDLTDEAQVISINDMYTENTFSFIAREIKPFSNKSENFKTSIYHSNRFFSNNKASINLDWEYDENYNDNSSSGKNPDINDEIKDKLEDLGYDTSDNLTKEKYNEYVYDIIGKMELDSDVDISWFIENVLLKINKDFMNNSKYFAKDKTYVYTTPEKIPENICGNFAKDERVIILDKGIFNNIEFYLTTDGWISIEDVNTDEKVNSNIYDISVGGESIKDIVSESSEYKTDLKVSEFLDSFSVTFSNKNVTPISTLSIYKPIEYVTNMLFTDKYTKTVNTIKRFVYLGDTQVVGFKDRKDIIFERIDINEPIQVIIASNQINDSTNFKIYFNRKVID